MYCTVIEIFAIGYFVKFYGTILQNFSHVNNVCSRILFFVHEFLMLSLEFGDMINIIESVFNGFEELFFFLIIAGTLPDFL